MNTRVVPPSGRGAGDGGPCIGLDLRETYDWLAGCPHERPTDRFEIHSLASVFTLVLAETDWGRKAPLAQALGLNFDEAVGAIVKYFPHALLEVGPVLGDEKIKRSEDEAGLLELLWRCVTDPGEPGGLFAKILARRAQRPNPLWQDLGLRNRGELSTLMSRHFPDLARRNLRDFRWKAYLRRTMFQDADYMFCTTPSCLDCDDFFACFGDQPATSLPGPARRASDLTAAVV
jgi:nitrogen fixation protein NifQ